MNTIQAQYYVPELLIQAGATIRARNRSSCPRCGRRRSVSFNEELYYCHHAGCDFRGNSITLAKQLGLLHPLSHLEIEELKRARERARRAAEEVAFRLRERRLALQEDHGKLLDVYYSGLGRLKRNCQDEIGWSCLAYFYKQIPAVRAELTLLEDAPMPDRLRYLNANEGKQREMVCAVEAAGGLEDAQGRFIEVEF